MFDNSAMTPNAQLALRRIRALRMLPETSGTIAAERRVLNSLNSIETLDVAMVLADDDIGEANRWLYLLGLGLVFASPPCFFMNSSAVLGGGPKASSSIFSCSGVSFFVDDPLFAGAVQRGNRVAHSSLGNSRSTVRQSIPVFVSSVKDPCQGTIVGTGPPVGGAIGTNL